MTVIEAAKIPKARTDEFMSLGHIDRRAQRYMEKRLLRDLWRAWRNGETGNGDIANEAILRVPVPPLFDGAACTEVA